MAVNPKAITIRGRVSFPVWTYNEAVERNKTSSFPKNDPAQIAPEVNILVEQDQVDKLTKHITDVFLPYTAEQEKKGEKRDALDAKLIKRVEQIIADGDWGVAPPHLPLKEISEKNQPNAPECVASVKVGGPRGGDFTLEAIVHDESQLVIPDPDLLTFPARKPIGQTTLDMYPGCYVAITLNLSAFNASKSVNGISAYANNVFYLGNVEGDRFGGGADVNEDDIFMA